MVPSLDLLKYVTRGLPELVIAWRQTSAFQAVVLGYLGIRNPSYPFDIPLSGGGVLRVSSRLEVKAFWEVFARRCYPLPTDCRIIVDAGANVGVFSVWAAKQLPEVRIIAIEPCPATLAALHHNVSGNHLEDRIQTVQIALAAQTGERLMVTDAESPRRSLVPADQNPIARSAVRVRCVSLADLFDQYRLTSVDLLKMDIEGSEWEVLLSTPASVLRSIRHIRLEYHEVHARFGYSPEKLFAHLGSAGHVITHLQQDRHRTGLVALERK